MGEINLYSVLVGNHAELGIDRPPLKLVLNGGDYVD